MRTTINIDNPTLRQIKRIQKREGKTLGRVVSDLLAQSLTALAPAGEDALKLAWVSKRMGARIDLADKRALLQAMGQACR